MRTGRPAKFDAHIVARREQAIYGIPEYVFKAWKAQHDSCIRRGIPFRFGLFAWDQWWKRELLKLSPDAKRGRRKGEYLMARFGDQGAYEHDNVYAATAQQNYHDVPAGVRKSASEKAIETARRNGKPFGEHLKLGNRHPCAKPVVTPAGEFMSIRLAAQAHGISERAGRRRVKVGLWRLVD